jgi:hypothetical protein
LIAWPVLGWILLINQYLDKSSWMTSTWMHFLEPILWRILLIDQHLDNLIDWQVLGCIFLNQYLDESSWLTRWMWMWMRIMTFVLLLTSCLGLLGVRICPWTPYGTCLKFESRLPFYLLFTSIWTLPGSVEPCRQHKPQH